MNDLWLPWAQRVLLESGECVVTVGGKSKTFVLLPPDAEGGG